MITTTRAGTTDPSIELLDAAIERARAAPLAGKVQAVEHVLATARQILVDFAARLAALEARR